MPEYAIRGDAESVYDLLVPAEGTTPSQTVGPFFAEALQYEAGPLLVAEDHPGAMWLTGRLLDGEAVPVPDALVEIWQAGPDGRFVQEPGIYQEPTGFRGFGRCATDERGQYHFLTVKPAAVPTVVGGSQAPHITLSVFARGMLRQVVTRVYFEDEPEANAVDPLLCDVGDRASTLVARTDDSDDGGYVFDVRIRGDQETVFLDVFAR